MSKTFKITKEKGSFERLFGDNRFATAYTIADKYKSAKGITKLDTIIVADGQNYPDALAGGPLALEKSGPLILANDDTTVVERITAYAKAANTTQATVYGGTIWISDASVRMILQMN